ncbi:MAG: hypothetical protein M1838_001042 [Thelocarpon superellum]|nr:MAG: hypothetical protein M1838_001042 [Thelocarpon superellum]
MSRCTLLLSLVLAASPLTMSESCVPLSGSKVCSAFNESSVSTNAGLVSLPFLAFVSSTAEFDNQLNQYLGSSYAQLKYQQLLGCSNLNLTNTTNLYARYTASVVCNAIVQNSKTPCALSDGDSRPLCADTCAQQAESEQRIIADNGTCSKPNPRALDQIRADFTVCSLPSNSLSGECIEGAENEPVNCGFANNTVGLCSYCSSNSPNSTDTCCFTSNTTQCAGVVLPSLTPLPPLFPSSTPTTRPSSTASPASSHSGLTGGQIAGVVIGSILGLALIVGLLVFLCLYSRRGKGSQSGSVFNQPSATRRSRTGMTFNPMGGDGPQSTYEALPGGRIARMSALEGPSANSLPTEGGATGEAATRRSVQDSSSSDGFGESPDPHNVLARDPLYPPPMRRRTGSLSSSSALGRVGNRNSTHSGSGGDMSSPHGMSSGQSEQLPFFKDYYSQDEIHPNSKVATLWAYQPRAGDEFELERGDMLKVIGIWDDGWATGVRLTEKAEDYDAKRTGGRDSGLSNGSGQTVSSPPPPGEIKAFPLVCVCLPEHWKRTVDGDEPAQIPAGTPAHA